MAEVLGIPTIDIFSFAHLQPFFGKPLGVPNPVAYLPQMATALPTNMVRSGPRFQLAKQHLVMPCTRLVSEVLLLQDYLDSLAADHMSDRQCRRQPEANEQAEMRFSVPIFMMYVLRRI